MKYRSNSSKSPQPPTGSPQPPTSSPQPPTGSPQPPTSSPQPPTPRPSTSLQPPTKATASRPVGILIAQTGEQNSSQTVQLLDPPTRVQAQCVVLDEFLAPQELDELMSFVLQHESEFQTSEVLSPTGEARNGRLQPSPLPRADGCGKASGNYSRSNSRRVAASAGSTWDGRRLL